MGRCKELKLVSKVRLGDQIVALEDLTPDELADFRARAYKTIERTWNAHPDELRKVINSPGVEFTPTTDC
jgi:hypothetical protein